MDATELTATLRRWTAEFAAIREQPLNIPDALYPFLSARLVELGIANDDWDVLTAKVSGVPTKVRITGVRGRRLEYQRTDGTVVIGISGIIPIEDVRLEDRGKLTKILDRFMTMGRVKEAGGG